MWEVREGSRLTSRLWFTQLVVPTPRDGIEGKEADLQGKRDTDLGAKLGIMIKRESVLSIYCY